MNESNGYAVFLFPQALEVLGEAIKPYLQDSPAGAHVLCNEIDTGGALVEMTLRGQDSEGRELALELMVPTSMVRMVVSTRSDERFGFGPKVAVKPEPVLPAVAAAGPAPAPASARAPAAPAPDGAAAAGPQAQGSGEA